MLNRSINIIFTTSNLLNIEDLNQFRRIEQTIADVVVPLSINLVSKR